jgi:hypothetical protein
MRRCFLNLKLNLTKCPPIMNLPDLTVHLDYKGITKKLHWTCYCDTHLKNVAELAIPVSKGGCQTLDQCHNKERL